MFVAADFRGSKHDVASNLLAYAENWMTEQKGKTIYLGTTERFLAAHKFYRKNGYQQIIAMDLPLSFPIMAVNKLLFKKEFQKYC